MRISDWSSDVCSSDFVALPAVDDEVVGNRGEHVGLVVEQVAAAVAVAVLRPVAVARRHELAHAHRAGVAALEREDVELRLFLRQREQLRQLTGEERRAPRSEEHTSELQSLMRISYAVFCLKKKKQKNKTIHQQ